jgi:predicted enzyme related to lactoylglutathione lyase
MNPVVHFEMPAEDTRRVADFYSSVFGWKAQMLGEEMGNYVTVSTTETDENGMVKTPGAINGGFFPKKMDVSAMYPSVVISVDNLEEAMQKVKRANGAILGNPDDIPGIGKYVAFTDTEGNRVGMLQPLMR